MQQVETEDNKILDEFYEASTQDKCVAEMNDSLMKNPKHRMVSRTFFKSKKAMRSAQKKSRKKNRSKK